MLCVVPLRVELRTVAVAVGECEGCARWAWSAQLTHFFLCVTAFGESLLWAVAATIVQFFIGSTWYSVLFSKAWEAGLKREG